MLKPPVVSLLLNTYRVAVVVALIGVYALGVHVRQIPPPVECRWRHTTPVLAFAILSALIYGIGSVVDAERTSFHVV